MKSSSELFPVTLSSAELNERWNEDTYLLKPNNSPDSTVEFALTRFSRSGKAPHGSVLWLPHFLTGRTEWLDEWGRVLEKLLDEGFDVWFLEWRGHGASRFNANWARNSLDEIAQCDVPAACAFIVEQTGDQPLVIADRSATQVWVAAHEQNAGGRQVDPQISGALLLWPHLGPVSVAAYIRAMGWEDNQLQMSRHTVTRTGHHECLNRILFDQLMLGQPARLRRWRASLMPAPFCAVENKSQEKLIHKWLSSLDDGGHSVRFSAPEDTDAALLTRWLDEVISRRRSETTALATDSV